jgi:hypothetical protein
MGARQPEITAGYVHLSGSVLERDHLDPPALLHVPLVRLQELHERGTCGVRRQLAGRQPYLQRREAAEQPFVRLVGRLIERTSGGAPGLVLDPNAVELEGHFDPRVLVAHGATDRDRGE